jgi:hypothetical protein
MIVGERSQTPGAGSHDFSIRASATILTSTIVYALCRELLRKTMHELRAAEWKPA